MMHVKAVRWIAVLGIIVLSSLAYAALSDPGDANGDNAVNIADAQIIVACLSKNPSTCIGKPDQNNDGRVDIFDFIACAKVWGTDYNSPPHVEYCGNLVCNATAGESCGTCALDCGTCPTGGFTDTVGVYHPNMPSTFTPIVGRFFQTRKVDNTQTGSGNYPYKTGATEGMDTVFDVEQIQQDSTRPFQAQVAALYPAGDPTNIGRVVQNPSEVAGLGFGKYLTFAVTPTTTRYPPSLRGKYKSAYYDMVFKLDPNWEHYYALKVGIWTIGSHETSPGSSSLNGNAKSPNMFMNSVGYGSSDPRHGSTTDPISLRWNTQGTYESSAGAVAPNDRQWLTFQPGYSIPRGKWVRYEVLSTINPPGVANGTLYFWTSEYDESTQTWSTPVQHLAITDGRWENANSVGTNLQTVYTGMELAAMYSAGQSTKPQYMDIAYTFMALGDKIP